MMAFCSELKTDDCTLRLAIYPPAALASPAVRSSWCWLDPIDAIMEVLAE